MLLTLIVSCSQNKDDKKENDKKKEVKKMTYCDCKKLNEKMSKEFEAVDYDEKKTAKIKDKYKDETKACKQAETDFKESLKGKSQEEMQKAFKEITNCD